MISRTRLKEVLEQFTRVELGVLGDVMLDEYLWGKVERISPEAPVPVVQIKKETWRPGGAANVAANMVALGARVHIFGVVGQDGNGKRLKECLEAEKIETAGLVFDPNRRTTVKTRIIGHNQQMVRIDRESIEPILPETMNTLRHTLETLHERLAGVVVSDYAKGVISKEIMAPLISQSRRTHKFVAIDPKLKNYPLYEGATLITPNTREAESALGRVFENEADVLRGGMDLLKQFGTDAALITRGEHGMSLFERGIEPVTIPTRALDVFDVTGAGDTVIATLSLALAAGCQLPEAAEIANLAAGVVVGIVGTATASKEQIFEHYDRINVKATPES
jgi:D-beta-D-heptose 7-phosphate kinase/D-beta-D-heptose 1-phosphate adenosyltransferase